MSVRGILAGGLAAVAVMAAAAPAAAKCGHGIGEPCPDPVTILAIVDGPNLGAPLFIQGPDAWSMLNVTGVTYRPYNVRDYPPDRLGPRYAAEYRFTQGKRTWVVYQDIYPYAAGRPFAYTESGQRYVEGGPSVEAQGGWRGSRTLELILQAHGLPAAAAAGSTTTSAGVVGSPGDDDEGGPPSWAWLAVGAGLLGVSGLAAARRFRKRSAGAPA